MTYILKTYNSMEGLKNRAAQTGNWQAKGDLSLVYLDGIPELNVEKHLDSAIGWMESSIEHGNPVPSGICDLGTMYDLKGTTSYQRKAYEMYLKAAPFGVVRAELNLAEIYRCGVEGVVTEDLKEAFKWYRRAAGEEKVDLDETGEGISREMSLMRGTLRRLGIDTKIKALRLLHKYYMSGECPEGKPQPLKAIYYLKRAAEIGDIESQKELGLTYLTGVSEVPKDLEKAKRWLRKAANHGSIEAKEGMPKEGLEGSTQENMLKITDK
ncbi:hypothetical protein QZH41_004163 [Actinostola sp. cb2023]|nr:hypothetical protein QZH41_004163 [Actinostola sp. cb2023]